MIFSNPFLKLKPTDSPYWYIQYQEIMVWFLNQRIVYSPSALIASGKLISTFLMFESSKINWAVRKYITPNTVNINPIPRPGPIPKTFPRVLVNLLPFVSRGEKILSDTGPVARYAKGIIEKAIIRLTENTRPWTSWATFDCQIACELPLVMGKASIPTNCAAVIKGMAVKNPVKMVDIPIKLSPR